jgi:hypothetical protein
MLPSQVGLIQAHKKPVDQQSCDSEGDIESLASRHWTLLRFISTGDVAWLFYDQVSPIQRGFSGENVKEKDRPSRRHFYFGLLPGILTRRDFNNV